MNTTNQASGSGTAIAEKHLEVLRHMLGIETPEDREPKPYRDYYCATKDDVVLQGMMALGLVELYRQCDLYDWYRCTPKGRIAAMRSHRAIRHPKAKRVYIRYLRVRDCFADLSFREFLVNPEFTNTRRDA